MPLMITVEPTDEFQRDAAHYHVRPDSVERISRHLRADPSRGKGEAARPDIRHWETGGMRVSYSFHVLSAESALLILLRIRPVEEPPSTLGAKALEAIDVINRIRALASGWNIGKRSDD